MYIDMTGQVYYYPTGYYYPTATITVPEQTYIPTGNPGTAQITFTYTADKNYCKFCYSELNQAAKFCHNCGVSCEKEDEKECERKVRLAD
jgi:hypothetical protein